MSDINKGTGMTKADLILSRLEQMARQNSALEAKVNSLMGKGTPVQTQGAASSQDDVIAKLSKENSSLRQELSYISVQVESVYNSLARSMQQLSDEVKALKGEGVALATADGKEVSAPIDYDAIGIAVAQNIKIPQAIAEDIDYEALSDKLSEKLNLAPAAVAESEQAQSAEDKTKLSVAAENLDYDAIGLAVAKNIYVPQAFAEDIDYDELAKKISEKLQISVPAAQTAEPVKAETAPVAAIDYDALAAKVAALIVVPAAQPVVQPVRDIDADALAEKVAAACSVHEVVSPDYIASKVAEQVVIPQPDLGNVLTDMHIETISRKVADKIAIPAQREVDEDRIAYSVVQKLREEEESEQKTEEQTVAAAIDEGALAEDIASKLNVSLSDELIAAAVVKNLAGAIDSDEIADCVAKKVGSISPEEFEINVDDDGCDSLARSIESKLDYERISASVAEKLAPAIAAANEREVDVDELSTKLSEKLSVSANINEDVLADKAASVLSNYLPEIDAVDIADKVVAGVIPVIPAAPVIDSAEIAAQVSEKLVENQENSDYDIVIDEEGLARITDSVSSEIKGEYNSRFDKLEGDIAELKQGLIPDVEDDVNYDEMPEYTEADAEPQTADLIKGYEERFDKLEGEISAAKQESGERFDRLDGTISEAKEQRDARFDKVERDIAEIKKMLIGGAVVAAAGGIAAADAAEEEAEDKQEDDGEQLVTVSDLVDENEETNAASDEAAPADVMEEIVEDIDESPVDEEIMSEDMTDDVSSGVDFANMMKYNRSFIARIIQGTDEQKNYYGKVKTALLSYKKVNSNIAWGAERFNKGRETIARFKIRGKTLCLYLALDPNEFATSVYHHADVSDNKSMHGTPMMVKIKSPLGVKKAIRLIDEMLARRGGVKREIAERDYAAMYPYESMEELIEDGLVKDVSKK